MQELALQGILNGQYDGKVIESLQQLTNRVNQLNSSFEAIMAQQSASTV